MKALAAEVAGKLSAALRPVGLRVRELTGDMQLTRKEMVETQARRRRSAHGHTVAAVRGTGGAASRVPER